MIGAITKALGKAEEDKAFMESLKEARRASQKSLASMQRESLGKSSGHLGGTVTGNL